MTSQEFLTPGILAFLFVGMLLSSLLPALVLKLVMDAIFKVRVSYLIVLLMAALSAMAVFMAIAWLGLLDAMLQDRATELPPSLTLSLGAAGILVEAVLLSLFATDEDGQFIAIWKWVVGIFAQMIVYVVIGTAIGLLIVLAQTNGG